VANVRAYPVFTVTMTAVISADQAQDFANTFSWVSARQRLLAALSAMDPALIDDSRVVVSGLRVHFEHLGAVRLERGE
jgi:hypothetical protein